jgi:hypothetical protein
MLLHQRPLLEIPIRHRLQRDRTICSPTRISGNKIKRRTLQPNQVLPFTRRHQPIVLVFVTIQRLLLECHPGASFPMQGLKRLPRKQICQSMAPIRGGSKLRGHTFPVAEPKIPGPHIIHLLADDRSVQKAFLLCRKGAPRRSCDPRPPTAAPRTKVPHQPKPQPVAAVTPQVSGFLTTARPLILRHKKQIACTRQQNPPSFISVHPSS